MDTQMDTQLEQSNQQCRYQGLRIASDILLNIFWIGYVILILAWLAFSAFKGQWQAIFVNQWHVVNWDTVELLTLGFFTLGKFVLLFYALIPTLAIRLTLRKLDKKAS